MNNPQAKFFSNDANFLKYGYYQISNFKTLSKFEAYQYAKENNLSFEDIEYFFNNDKFSNFDWSKEPLESIGDLYKKRAEELRQQYDHIVVLYSGGIDSHVILQTFIDNNIKVDEIVTFWNSTDRNMLFNQEVFNSAVPYIESLNLENLGTVFNLVDIKDALQNQFDDDRHLLDIFHTINGLICPWTYYIRSGKAKVELFPHHVEMSKKDKKVLYLWGLDKPNLLIEDGYYGFRYVDSVPDFGVKTFINKTVYKEDLSNVYDEGFFASYSSPEILIKQCHLIVNQLNLMSPLDERLYSHKDLKAGEVCVFYDINPDDPTKNLLLSKKELQKIIYPNVDHSRFKDDKVFGSTFYTRRDAWFFRQKTEVRNKTIDYFKKILRENDDYFKYTIDGTPDTPLGIKGNIFYKISKKNV
jgi:hypothetical protein